ncbi:MULTISPECIES: hypothetical protein [Vibrio]|uniref:Lipoprotein n=1 Tax=Vibrio chanodichtyis TaxID=3027932 RepID=A0ABT5UVV0_9VIBR|nr:MULTISPECIES: hypothetical protein [Vibrio]MDE1513533.1 hypothetical protein [Vibrio chanodichtyis]
MQFPKRTVAVAIIVGLLSACGGSEESSPLPPKTLTAIDGYLIGAEVYVDRNQNGKADADEKLDQLSGEKGQIAIPSADAEFDVIVKAIAGKTRDSDKGGTVEQSFELLAKSTSSVASPFTTIAFAQNKTMEALAAELGYDSNTLSHDYVALKNSAEDAKSAHLFARSIVSSLDMDKNSDDFATRMKSINDEIDKLINQDKELDDIVIYLSDTGVASVSSMPPTLTEFMDKQTYVSFSMNDFWRTRDNGDEVAYWQFDINNNAVKLNEIPLSLAFDKLNPNSFFMTWSKEPNVECEYPYGSVCRSEMQDDFIFMENEFALAISVDGDIQIYLKPRESESIDHTLNGVDQFDLTSSSIELNTYHHLDDKSTDWSPKPSLRELSGGTIKIISADNGTISFGDLEYQVIRGNGQIYIIKRADGHPSLLFRNEQLADLMKSKWENHKLEQPDD